MFTSSIPFGWFMPFIPFMPRFCPPKPPYMFCGMLIMSMLKPVIPIMFGNMFHWPFDMAFCAFPNMGLNRS